MIMTRLSSLNELELELSPKCSRIFRLLESYLNIRKNTTLESQGFQYYALF